MADFSMLKESRSNVLTAQKIITPLLKVDQVETIDGTGSIIINSPVTLDDIVIDTLAVNDISPNTSDVVNISEAKKCIIASSSTSTIPDLNSIDCAIIASNGTNTINSTTAAEISNTIISSGSNANITSGASGAIIAAGNSTINSGTTGFGNAIIASDGGSITGKSKSVLLGTTNSTVSSTTGSQNSIISSASGTISGGFDNTIMSSVACAITGTGQHHSIISSENVTISNSGINNSIISSFNSSISGTGSSSAIIGSQGGTITADTRRSVILCGDATTTCSANQSLIVGIGSSTINQGCLVLGDATTKTNSSSTTHEATLTYTNGIRAVSDSTHGLKFGLLSGGVLDFTNQSFLRAYEEYSASFNFTSSSWATPTNAFTLTFRRVGKLCFLHMSAISAAAGGTAPDFITSVAVDARFRPATEGTAVCVVNQNGTPGFTGLIRILSSGVITIYYNNLTLGTFSNLGAAANGTIYSNQLVYYLA